MGEIRKQKFGNMPDGRAVDLYTLVNLSGLEARIMTYGGTLVSLRTPDREGALADVVLGFDELSPHLGEHPYFGCLVGRYANRIAGGSFRLNDKRHQLARNDGCNHLHGGINGFSKVLWEARARISATGPQLALSYESPAGEEGYPGNLIVEVIYTLSDGNELGLHYSATTDADTVLNLTNHAYFNLAGSGTVLDQVVRLAADHFLPVDETLIPLGERRAVLGTPFDFTRPETIGSRIHADEPQLRFAGGYDHCWVLNKMNGKCALAAELQDPQSGRMLSVFTTQPGMQVYTGNFLDGSIRGKAERAYERHSGLCLETQHFPDSPNQPTFPTTILKRGEHYRETTVYRFAVDQSDE
jgi:aldose 1-epimerase